MCLYNIPSTPFKKKKKKVIQWIIVVFESECWPGHCPVKPEYHPPFHCVEMYRNMIRIWISDIFLVICFCKSDILVCYRDEELSIIRPTYRITQQIQKCKYLSWSTVILTITTVWSTIIVKKNIIISASFNIETHTVVCFIRPILFSSRFPRSLVSVTKTPCWSSVALQGKLCKNNQ